MQVKLQLIIYFAVYVSCEKQKPNKTISVKKYVAVKNKTAEVPKIIEEKLNLSDGKENKTNTPKFAKIPEFHKKKHEAKMIPPELMQSWAQEISEKLIHVEERVVHRDVLMKAFSELKMETRNGAAIVEEMAKAMEELLERRSQAAEHIMRQAENFAQNKDEPPTDYVFNRSLHLDKAKKQEHQEPGHYYELPVNCSSLRLVPVEKKTHFGADTGVKLDISSVQVSAEVFECAPQVLQHIYWSEALLSAFQQNYEKDAMTDFQYFCSVKGFLRHYPAASWSSMFKLSLVGDEEEGPADVYDCRLRPWYVAAGGAPRDILILLDASGSMVNSSNKVNSEQFTLALLSALTDDDQVNVLRFNVIVESPISCFNDKLVPANHVNSAAMMAALETYEVVNTTLMASVLKSAVAMLQRQQLRTERPPSCQQAIVLVTDSVYENYTEDMRKLDPTGRIRLFVVWLHDECGLRDNSRKYGEWLSCSSDGHLSDLMTASDVTEQVMRILRVLERPLVSQRKKRLRVFSDVFAHLEDPRRSEYYWGQKENVEQAYRYTELRRNKEKLLSASQSYKDFMHQESLDKLGHYYEGQDLDYRLQISVSVPVFDHTVTENITIVLAEEKQRNSTRTYPVNRLLGVAGVDIPIEHLKLILPYNKLGPGGSVFIIDHRGYIVVHDSLKPTFDGDILRPGYRTVDILDLEQPGVDLPPRNYSRDWLDFRQALVIEQPKGSRLMFSKYIFEDGLRASLEIREYQWRRVMDHYTAVVVLPKYNRRHGVADGKFTQQLANSASASDVFDSDASVHPDWLYCRHVDRHFEDPEFEVRHFISRRKEEPDFAMKKLQYVFSPIKPALLEKNYQCNEELMARLCKELIITKDWVLPLDKRECPDCELGSVIAFFATESGLTRWQDYQAASAYASPPNGNKWPRGPDESWYKRAAALPDKLVIHAAVTPIRKLRNSDRRPPPLGERYQWFTAARVLGQPEKGIYGVSGYHFYPQHLEYVLKSVTNPQCDEYDEDDCEAVCDGENWSCVLIDEGGWIVGGHWTKPEDVFEEDPAREHLARLYPHAMHALLTAGVFKLHWIHDYQAVCFPPLEEERPKKDDAASLIPIPTLLIKTLWRSFNLLLCFTRELVTILAILSSASSVTGDTKLEIEKRTNKTRRDYEREKYDRLYDDRVLVNRTRFAACDRSRPLYELQRTTKAMDLLKRPPKVCCNSGCTYNWPLVGAVVPSTNLVLLAIYNLCPYDGRPLPDPLANIAVDMDDAEWVYETAASKLACWRNRVTLPARAPLTACYPHNYLEEEQYRQCGPWLPDPEAEDGASHTLAQKLTTVLSIFAILLNLI